MDTTRTAALRAATPFAAGGLILAVLGGLLPLLGRSPALAGTLLTASVFAILPLVALAGGIVAGLVVGAGVLLGTILGLAAFGWIAGSYPDIQELVRNSEPNPEARLPYEAIAPVGAAAGALIGVLAGLTYLVPAALGGLLGAATGKPNRRIPAPQPTH
jgi:hypothetical protein